VSQAEVARRKAVAVRVGDREVTVGEVEDRIASVPRFQLSTMGDTPDAIRKKYVVEVIVPEVLLAAEAGKQHIEDDPNVRRNEERALANALKRSIKAEVGSPESVSMDDVRRYYNDNRAKFDTPQRFSVWRILCATREEAIAVIDAAKASLTVDTFTKLAREHSLDKATNMRSGNLGFIDAQGSSNEAGLKVNPAIASAAASVKDGQLFLLPVPEGPAFAVVWHRGTVAAVRRTPEEAASQIREMIHRQRLDDANQTLILKLRSEHLREYNDSVLNGIEVSSGNGEVTPRKRPGQVSPLNASGRASAAKP
jgi:peptidyl-prolyl cis-trans isomerase C